MHNQCWRRAFLFWRFPWRGKTTCARILAKTINCENLQPNGESLRGLRFVPVVSKWELV